jgi:hypothetical protein
MLYALLLALVAFGSCTAFLAVRSHAERARRAQLVARIRQGEATQVLLQEQVPFARRARRARYTAQRRSRRLTSAGRRRDALSHHTWHGARWSFGIVVSVLVGACLWAILFALQRETDVNLLIALGYASPSTLGVITALAFALAGMVVCGLLGLHPLLPSWIKSAGRFGRIVAALMLAAVSITFLAYLEEIAVNRSVDRFSAEVSALQSTLQHTPRGTPVEQVARTALANAQERLAAGKTLDHSLATTVLTVEMALSAAPILAVELAVIGYYAVAANRADRLLGAARRTISRTREEYNGYAVGLLAEAGEPVASVNRRLAELPELDAEPPPGFGSHHVRGGGATDSTLPTAPYARGGAVVPPISTGPAMPSVPPVPAEDEPLHA